MCDCKNNNKGNGETIALAFERNKGAVCDVFEKYGMPGVAASKEPIGTLVIAATVVKGLPFLRDVSMAAAGLNPEVSSYNDEEKTDLAASILSMFGIAADAGINIAKGVQDIKNSGKNNTGGSGSNTTQQPNPVIVYQTPPSTPAEPKRYFGFTGGQLALLLLAAAAVIGMVVWFKNED